MADNTYPAAWPVWTTKFDYTTVVYGDHINMLQRELVDGIQRTLDATPQISRHDPGSTPPELLVVQNWLGDAPASALAAIITILDDSGPTSHGYNATRLAAALRAAWTWSGSWPTGDPTQVATWISKASPVLLTQISSQLKALPQGVAPLRADASRWIGSDTNRTAVAQGVQMPVNPRNHVTVSSRLAYQGRVLHLPYYRGTAYDVAVQEGTWMRPTLRAYDDPYRMASGPGVCLNQDGLWRVEIKTDHSPVPGSVAVGIARVVRLEVDGVDVGFRDYLDDDSDTSRESITSFTWTEEFRAGTKLTLGMRVEGVPANYDVFANVYLRVYLVRATEGAFDHYHYPGDGPIRGGQPDNPRDPCPPHTPRPGNHWWDDDRPQVVFTGDLVVYADGPGEPVQTSDPYDWVSDLHAGNKW